MEKLHNKHIIEIVIAIGGAIVLGWLIKKIVFPILYKFTNKTKWKSDDLIIESIGKWVIFWFLLAAFAYITPIFTETFSYAS